MHCISEMFLKYNTPSNAPMSHNREIKTHDFVLKECLDVMHFKSSDKRGRNKRPASGHGSA